MLYFFLFMILLALSGIADEIRKLRKQNLPDDAVDGFYWPEDKEPELSWKQIWRKRIQFCWNKYKNEKYKSKYYAGALVIFAFLLRLFRAV